MISITDYFCTRCGHQTAHTEEDRDDGIKTVCIECGLEDVVYHEDDYEDDFLEGQCTS